MKNSCEHNKDEHVDGCLQNDVWRDSHPSSIGPVDSKTGRVVELQHQVAKNSAFP